MSKQRTISKSISLKGVGLHSGNEVNLTFKPAEEDFGYAFCRTDLPEKPIIEADVNYVVSTKRGTTLEKNGEEDASFYFSQIAEFIKRNPHKGINEDAGRILGV